MRPLPMVIVGGGECGAKAVLSLRKHGWDGEILLIGEEPVLPYERPPLSKAVMVGEAESAPLSATQEAYDTAGVTLVLGRTATAIDPTAHTVTLDDGTVQPYAALLLATGARPRLLPGSEEVADRIHYLRSELDAARLRELLQPGARVAVIGGGFIGLELAAAARHLGCEVDVVEALPRLLTRAVPAVLADRLASRHTKEGVRLHLGATVDALIPSGAEGVSLTLSDGTQLQADLVIAGIGSVPNTELAAAAGLAVDNGIIVDRHLTTSAPDIYAAGDCAAYDHPLFPDGPARFESWRLALEAGVHAGAGMAGGTEEFGPVPWFWSDQYDLTLQVAGLARDVTQEVVRALPDGALLWFGLDASGRLVAMAALGSQQVIREIRIGERLIADRVTPDPAALADPGVALRSLRS